jgi:hypothetical protein
MKLTSCHVSGPNNFEVAPRFLENLCSLVLSRENFPNLLVNPVYFTSKEHEDELKASF